MKIADELYNIFNPLSLALYVRISIADRQISSRFAAYHLRLWRKYRFTLISPHPPSPRRRAPAPRRSRPLFVTPKACHLSRYRESLPHKDFFKIGRRSVCVVRVAARRAALKARQGGVRKILFARLRAESASDCRNRAASVDGRVLYVRNRDRDGT